MQEKVELNKLRSFGEIIDDSVLFFKQNWKPLLKSYFYICGFFWATSLLLAIISKINAFQRVDMGESQYGTTYFISLGFEYLTFIIITLTVLSFISAYKEKGNQPPDVTEVWGFVKYYFFRVFGSYLLLTICILCSFFFFIIPAIYLIIVFSLVIPIIIIENSTLSYAFSRCFQLIKNNWWPTLGVILVSNIIVAAALIAVAIPVEIIVYGSTFLTNVKSTEVYTYTYVIIVHLLQFVYIFPIIAVTISYFNFVEQKDEGNLLQRIMNIGSVENIPTPEITEEY